VRGAVLPLVVGLALPGCRQPDADRSAGSAGPAVVPSAASAAPAVTAAPTAAQAGPASGLDRGLPHGDFTTVAIHPNDPAHLVAGGAQKGGLWEHRAGGPPGFQAVHATDAGALAHHRVSRLLHVEHPAEGPALLVQLEPTAKGSTPTLYRAPWRQLREGARRLSVDGTIVALATDPHAGRQGRVAAVVLGGEDGGPAVGCVAYSADGGDRFRRFHPSGRCYLACALAFGSDRHLWMVSLGSVPGAQATGAGTASLQRITAALLAGKPPGEDLAELSLLPGTALLAINPERREVTERLELPMIADRITVHPDLSGTAWLAGPRGLMRLRAARVRPIPMRTVAGKTLEPPLQLAGITLFAHPTTGAEQVFVALAGDPSARRGVWLGEQEDGAWRFERVSDGPSPRFPDRPGGPVVVAARQQLVVAPYGPHGLRRSMALGAPGSWVPVQ